MERVKKKWMVTYNPSYHCMDEFLDISTKDINESIRSMLLDCHVGYITTKDNKCKYLATDPCYDKYFLIRLFIADVMGSIPINAIEFYDDDFIDFDSESHKSNVYIYENIIIANYYWFDNHEVSERTKAKRIAKKLSDIIMEYEK